jgi:hypothetical protein
VVKQDVKGYNLKGRSIGKTEDIMVQPGTIRYEKIENSWQ